MEATIFGTRILGPVLLLGASVAIVATVLAAPKLLRAARPLAREALKRGIETYARARSATAEFVEDVEDLVAEVQAELTRERPRPAEDTNPPQEARGA